MAVLHDDILPAVQGSARQLTQRYLVRSERHGALMNLVHETKEEIAPRAVKSWIAFPGSLQSSGGSAVTYGETETGC